MTAWTITGVTLAIAGAWFLGLAIVNGSPGLAFAGALGTVVGAGIFFIEQHLLLWHEEEEES